MKSATSRQYARLHGHLIHAAERGDIHSVLELLEQIRCAYHGQHHNFDSTGLRLLRYIFPGVQETSDWVTTNIYERAKLAALQVAAKSGRKELVKAVLALGVDVKSRMAEGILFVIAHRGHRNIAKLLVKAGMNVNSQFGPLTPLETASLSGHCQMVRFLVENGAKRTADSLCHAAMYGHVKVVRFLLEHGVDLKAKTRQGQTVRCMLRWYPPKAHREEILRLIEEANNAQRRNEDKAKRDDR